MLTEHAPLTTPLPFGFLASGIHCGVRRYRPDLGLIVSDTPATVAGVFTQNHCKAAPVRYCQRLLPSQHIKAIITNSGQANAATGPQGDQDNQAMATATAQALACNPHQILTASTGVIGAPLAIQKIQHAIPQLVTRLNRCADYFATAILTTDLVPKTISRSVTLSEGTIQLTGICKGSGMIHPNMATMLGYLLTDVALSPTQAQQLLSHSTALSFNRISVDGETSTNDSVFLMANGASGIAPQTDQDWQQLQTAITDMAILLAKSIVKDGEGAHKLIEVTINGAISLEQAETLARSLTVSPLIKTAVHGASANWGRVIARLGCTPIGEHFSDHCQIKIQNHIVFNQGQAITQLNTEQLVQAMHQDTILIEVNLNQGDASATAWGCDLSADYININADYLS